MSDREEYEVLVIKYGTRSTTRADVFLNYGLYGEPDAPIQMDYFCWVVRNAARTVLVDTGFSQAGGGARGRTMLADPRDALAGLGVNMSDEPTVVITHAHYDHAAPAWTFRSGESKTDDRGRNVAAGPDRTSRGTVARSGARTWSGREFWTSSCVPASG